jgi:hypothetical protein
MLGRRFFDDSRYGSEKSESRSSHPWRSAVFQGLAQRHDFVVHRAVCRRLAAFRNCLLMSVNRYFTIFPAVISETPMCLKKGTK